jgi:hypothetical protein
MRALAVVHAHACSMRGAAATASAVSAHMVAGLAEAMNTERVHVAVQDVVRKMSVEHWKLLSVPVHWLMAHACAALQDVQAHALATVQLLPPAGVYDEGVGLLLLGVGAGLFCIVQ